MKARSIEWGSIAVAFAVGLAMGVMMTNKPAPRFTCEGRIAETPYAELATPDEPDGEWLSDVIVLNCFPDGDRR